MSHFSRRMTLMNRWAFHNCQEEGCTAQRCYRCTKCKGHGKHGADGHTFDPDPNQP